MVSGTGRDYFVASAADKIYIDPAGGAAARRHGRHDDVLPRRVRPARRPAAVREDRRVQERARAVHRDRPDRDRGEDAQRRCSTRCGSSWLADGRRRPPPHARRSVQRARRRRAVHRRRSRGRPPSSSTRSRRPTRSAELVATELGEVAAGRRAAASSAPSAGSGPAIAVIYVDGDITDGKSQSVPLLGEKLAGGETLVDGDRGGARRSADRRDHPAHRLARRQRARVRADRARGVRDPRRQADHLLDEQPRRVGRLLRRGRLRRDLRRADDDHRLDRHLLRQVRRRRPARASSASRPTRTSAASAPMSRACSGRTPTRSARCCSTSCATCTAASSARSPRAARIEQGRRRRGRPRPRVDRRAGEADQARRQVRRHRRRDRRGQAPHGLPAGDAACSSSSCRSCRSSLLGAIGSLLGVHERRQSIADLPVIRELLRGRAGVGAGVARVPAGAATGQLSLGVMVRRR